MDHLPRGKASIVQSRAIEPEPVVKEAVVGVIRRAGRMLVIQRGRGTKMAGYWSPPSGRIERGESQEQALVREMQEELGLAVRPLAKIWECRTDDGDYLLHWWSVEERGTELTLDPNEAAGAKWVTAEEFAILAPTFRGDRDFFRSIYPGIP